MISCMHKFDNSGDKLVSAVRGQDVTRQHVIHEVSDYAEVNCVFVRRFDLLQRLQCCSW